MPMILAIGLFYASIFAGTGASMPFIPVWFRAQGLSGEQIGLILSAPLLARVVVGPALALWADGFRLRRTPLALMAGVATAAFIALGVGHGFWLWMGAWFVGSILIVTLSPLTDVLALRRAAKDGFNYGWPRGIGSAGYVLANVGMGWVLSLTGPGSVLVWTISFAGLASLSGWLLLPPDPVHEGGEALSARRLLAGLGDLVRRPVFLLALIAIGLIQASHAFYYAFSALVWRRQGFSQTTVGLLWAFGVVIEIAFLTRGERWLRRVGPRRLLILGGAAAMIRWTALAFSPDLVWCFLLQALHALSYTATFLASLRLIGDLSPPQSASAAQTLNASLSIGLLTGLATMVSGPLFDRGGAQGYLAMTVVAGAGLIGAILLAGRMTRGEGAIVA